MWHLYILGLLVGWGVAVPIGPMNLEIIRRNLNYGLMSGVSFGAGIVTADLTYFVLLNLGILIILEHSAFMVLIGIIGSLLLFWFGIKTLQMKPKAEITERKAKGPVWKQTRDGYLLTLTSPMTILFWASMSSNIAVSGRGVEVMIITASGVMTGVISWMLGLNTVLHFTHHRLSNKVMHYLNVSGGLILLAFALFGLIRSLYLFG